MLRPPRASITEPSCRILSSWCVVFFMGLLVIVINDGQTYGLPSEKDQKTFENLKLRESHHNVEGSKGNIPVNIKVDKAHYLHGKIFIPTGVNISAKAEILDENFKNANLEYQWSVKNKTITTQPNASEIVYSFDRADADNFLEVLVFHHPNDTGVSNKSLTIRDSVTIADPIGKLFLEHGQLLNITLKFQGTGPFTYCHSFCLEKHLKKPESDCRECSPDIVSDEHEVHIIHYLHSVGNWTLSFVVDNIASRAVKNYSIKITDIVRPKSVPYVPIVSSILAVIILLSGVVLHSKFKRTIATETADFDFIRHDYNEQEESFWEEEQSFAQRVRYLLFNAHHLSHDNSMTDSNLSGVRIY